jgi:predicted component of type VI protein secretion system
MKNTTTLSLMLSLLLVACSSHAQSSKPASLPQFTIMAGDAVSTSVETNHSPIGYIVHIELHTTKAAELQRFSHDYFKQDVQWLVGTNFVTSIYFENGDISCKKIEFGFSRLEEAKRIADYLTKQP